MRESPDRIVPTSRVHVRKQSHDLRATLVHRRRLAGARGATRADAEQRAPAAGEPADRGRRARCRRRPAPGSACASTATWARSSASGRRSSGAPTAPCSRPSIGSPSGSATSASARTPSPPSCSAATPRVTCSSSCSSRSRRAARCAASPGSARSCATTTRRCWPRIFPTHLSADRFVALWRDIVRLLRSDPRFAFDFVDLQKMPETIGAQRNPFLDLPVLAHPSGAYVANLDGDWETFYAAKRSSSTRKKERRQLKHLAEFGEVRFVDVQDSQDIERTLETLISQKSRSFARMGVDDLFARPGYRDFFLDVATDLNVRALDPCQPARRRRDHGRDQSRPALPRLLLPDAVELSRRRVSRASGRDARTCTSCCAMPSSAALPASISPSATSPTSATGPTPSCGCTIISAAVTLRGAVVVALTAAYRRTKRVIKQSPTLWRAFSKAAGAGGIAQPAVISASSSRASDGEAVERRPGPHSASGGFRFQPERLRFATSCPAVPGLRSLALARPGQRSASTPAATNECLDPLRACAPVSLPTIGGPSMRARTTIAAASRCWRPSPRTARRPHDWPTRPITLVVPFTAGGGIDVSARIQAQRMGELLGQSIVVENVGAAAGTTGSQRVAKAAPDGYTMLIGNTGTHAYSQSLYKRPPYNSVTEFQPVGLVSEFAAHPARAQGPAGQQPAGIRRLRQSQPGQDAVRLGRRRLRHASALRAVQPQARAQHHPRALSRRRPGDAGPDRRPHRLHVRHHPDRRRSRPSRAPSKASR